LSREFINKYKYLCFSRGKDSEDKTSGIEGHKKTRHVKKAGF